MVLRRRVTCDGIGLVLGIGRTGQGQGENDQIQDIENDQGTESEIVIEMGNS